MGDTAAFEVLLPMYRYFEWMTQLISTLQRT